MKLDARAGSALDRAGTASGGKRTRLYRKARTALDELLGAATAAAGKGTLGVSLAPLETAVTALLALVPAA